MASSGLHAAPSTMVRTPTPLQSSTPSRSNQASPNPSLPLPSKIDDIDAVIQMATASARAAGPPILGKDTRTQLFVGNLPYRVRWQDLKDLFRKAGTVLRADVSLGPDNRSRGYGTVLLATAEDAGRAIDMFNGYSWQTRILEVRADRIPPEYDMGYPLPSPLPTGSFAQSIASVNQTFMPSVIPGLLYPSTQNVLDTSLEGIRSGTPLGTLGTSASIASMIGSSILTPSSPSFRSASAAGFPVPPPHSRAHSGLATTLYNSTPSSGLGRSLFVGNLPFQCQWQDLKDLFRRAGAIVRADVAIGPDGRSRGYGTVLFSNEPDADRAVAMFNGYEYNNRILKVHHDKFTQIPSSSPPPTAGLVDFHSQAQAYQLLRSLSANPAPTQSSTLSHHFSLHDIPVQSSSSTQSLASSLLRHSSQPTSPYEVIPPVLPPTVAHHPQGYDHVPQVEGLLNSHPPRSSTSAPPVSTSHVPSVNPFEAIIPPPPILRSPPMRPVLRAKVNSEPTEKVMLDNTVNTGPRFPSQDQLGPQSDDNPASQSTSWVPPEQVTETIHAHPSTPPQLTRLSKSTSPPSAGSAHPGPIQLPPQQFSLMSPLTRGLPPMTPSMPGFTFHPQTMTPPLYPHFLSPGFSPSGPGQSPTAYYTANPFLNATPGGLHQQMQGIFPLHSPPTTTPIMTMTPGAPMTPGHPLSPGHYAPHMLHRRVPFPLSPGHAPTMLPSDGMPQQTSEPAILDSDAQPHSSGGLSADFAAATAMIAAASNAGVATHHHSAQQQPGLKSAEPRDYFPMLRDSERSGSGGSVATTTRGSSSKDTTPETDVTSSGTDAIHDTTHLSQPLYGLTPDFSYIQEASLRLAMADLSLGESDMHVPRSSKSYLGEATSAPASAQKRALTSRTTSLEGFPGSIMAMSTIAPSGNATASSSASSNPRPRSGLLPPLELPRVDSDSLESQYLGKTRPPPGMISPGTARRASFNDRPRKPSGLGIGMD